MELKGVAGLACHGASPILRAQTNRNGGRSARVHGAWRAGDKFQFKRAGIASR